MTGPLPLAGLLALLAGAVAAQGGAPLPEAGFRLTNQGIAPIAEVYVASAAVNRWGEDRLGSGTLAPGASAAIALPAGQCVNDIRVVFAGGRAAERRRVNTCAEGDLAFR